MKLDYSSNNDSLAEIPRQVLFGEWNGQGHLESWRRLHFRTDDHSSGYDFDIRFSWYKDSGKNLVPPKPLYRASVKNVWKRSQKVKISQFGVELSSEDYNRVMGLVRERLLRLTGYRKLYDKTIYCYRLNHMFTFPLGVLDGKDVHHISNCNSFLETRCRNLHISYLDESWFGASDDRIKNMLSMSPTAHRLEHSLRQDNGYHENYRDLLGFTNPNLTFAI